MYRFFVDEDNHSQDEIYIQGDDVNHIRHVLRMDIGDRIMVSTGRGVDYECEIAEYMDQSIRLKIEKETPAITELPVAITLFQALPKKDKMEYVIQKAVELGATSIVPVQTRRCVVKLDEKKAEKKIARWQAIAKAAAKQSGRGIIPKIYPVHTMDQALDMATDYECNIIPYEMYDDMSSTMEIVRQAVDKRSIGIFIGPEGGFERSEVEVAISKGVNPISLGRRILRTETAGLAILSVLMFMIEGK